MVDEKDINNNNNNSNKSDDMSVGDYYFDYEECPESEVYPCSKKEGGGSRQRRPSPPSQPLKGSNDNLRRGP
jgi:hypothetical protein